MRLTKIIVIGIAALSSLSMSKCSDKKFQEDPPFTVGFSYAQKWVAGTQQGGSGINVAFIIENIQEGVSIDSVYYLTHKVGLETKPMSEDTYFGFITYKTKEDMVMSGEGTDEYGNPVPDVGSTHGYELTREQAVLEYTLNGKTYVTLVNGVAQKEQQNYPSANDGTKY